MHHLPFLNHDAAFNTNFYNKTVPKNEIVIKGI